MKRSLAVFKHAFSDFGADRCSDLAASLSYYTIFAIPPILLLTLMLVGNFVSPATVQSGLQGQASSFVGGQGASAIMSIMRSAHRPDMHNPLTALVGIVSLVLGALGFFLALQGALNRAWDVAPDPSRGGVKNFISQRIVSFITMLIVGLVALASLVASAAISRFSGLLAGYFPGGLAGLFLEGANFIVSFIVIGFLLTFLFKVLPDAHIAWGDVFVGAFFTSLLFMVGKLLIGLYLGHSRPGSAFGAAGSVILLLVWIYYSALILLFGAEFTQAYAVERGHSVRPKEGAVRIVETRASNQLANQPDSASADAHAVPGREGAAADESAERAGSPPGGEDAEAEGGPNRSQIRLERKEGGSEGRAAD